MLNELHYLFISHKKDYKYSHTVFTKLRQTRKMQSDKRICEQCRRYARYVNELYLYICIYIYVGLLYTFISLVTTTTVLK